MIWTDLFAKCTETATHAEVGMPSHLAGFPAANAYSGSMSSPNARRQPHFILGTSPSLPFELRHSTLYNLARRNRPGHLSSPTRLCEFIHQTHSL